MGKTKGADPGSGPIITERQTAVQYQLRVHPTDAGIQESRSRLLGEFKEAGLC